MAAAVVFRLELDQFPTHARLCALAGRVDKRPLDPPPVLHISCSDPDDRKHMLNANFNIRATLVSDKQEVVPLMGGIDRPLSGTIEQSIIKLEDTARAPRGFFIFSDLSVRMAGRFCIRFSLFEARRGTLRLVHRIFSSPFDVVHHRAEIPLPHPTPLTYALKRQGVKIRTAQPSRAKGKHPTYVPILTTPTSGRVFSPRETPALVHASFPKPHPDEFSFVAFLRSQNIPINSFLGNPY